MLHLLRKEFPHPPLQQCGQIHFIAVELLGRQLSCPCHKLWQQHVATTITNAPLVRVLVWWHLQLLELIHSRVANRALLLVLAHLGACLHTPLGSNFIYYHKQCSCHFGSIIVMAYLGRHFSLQLTKRRVTKSVFYFLSVSCSCTVCRKNMSHHCVIIISDVPKHYVGCLDV